MEGGDHKPRENSFSDDLVDACIFYIIDKRKLIIFMNIETGIDIIPKELEELICEVAGYDGKLFSILICQMEPQKLLDVSKINSYGWNAKTSLKEGLNKTIDWFNHLKIK